MARTRILIVEDEAVIGMHIQSSLIKLGYEVCGSMSTGEEAVRAASELKPDLILMDIVLQGRMDGIEAANIIKETLGIPVVYMTGNADVQTITKARETEPYGYVMKPINVLHLFSTIDTVLHRNKLETSLRESDEKLRRIIENSKDGIVLVDENGLIIEWNAGMERNTGLLKSDVIGRLIWDLQYKLIDKTLGKRFGLEFFKNMYLQILTGNPSDMANRYLEGKILRRDGSITIVEDLILQLPTIKGTMICIFQRDVTERRLAEEALREKTEELDRFFNLSLDLLCIAGIDGYFKRLNRSWETMLGYRLEDIEGKSFFGFIHPDDIESTNDVLAELSKGRDVINFTNRYRCKDGSYRWIEWRASPFQRKYIYAAARDITERKLTEDALRQSEERFRSITTNLPGAVYQFYVRDNGDMGLYYVDDRSQGLFGIDTHPIGNFFERFISNIHPDDRESFIASIMEVARRESDWDWEGRYINPSGREMWLRGMSHPTRKGSELIFNGMMLDITDRKIAELNMRESEEKFRGLVQNLQDIIIIMNTEGTIIFENPTAKETLGSSLMGKRGFDIIHPDDLKKAMDAFKEVVDKTNKHQPTMFRVRHADGSWLYIEALGTNMLDNKATPGMLLVCRDVTQRMKVQTALRESEERFRALMDNLQDMVVILDSAGMVKFENPSTQSTLGHSLLGTSAFDTVHPDDIPRSRKDFFEVIQKTNTPIPALLRARHRDGSWLYIEVLATNLFDNSIIQGIMVVGHDVTQHMQTQRALLESEQRYHALFHQSPVGVIRFDTEGIVTDCNERLAEIMHSSREKLIGIDLKALRERSVIPNILEALSGRSSFYEGQYRATTSDAQLFISSTLSPLYDGHGNVIGGMGVIDDVSDRKVAEEKLKASEERNRLLVENANEGIVVLQERRFVFANPKFIKLCGYAAPELAAKDYTEFLHHDDRPIIEDRYRKRMDGDRTPFTYEIRFISNEGIIKWAELNSVLFSWEGKPGVLLFIRDITERKLAEEERNKIEMQIQQTQKLESLGVLAGGIAHDFNNLLMAILGNIDLAILELNPTSQARGNLLEAAKASQRAADLCRQMLAYSGRGRFTSESLDLNEIIEDMSHMLEVSISKKAILRFNYAKGLFSIEADATQMRQIIMNLVINGSDAIGEKSGIISISTGMMDCDRSYLSETWLNEKLREGQYVYLEVADTGCGMDQKTLPKIFDPFFTTKFTGRGLGLAAVLGIVRGHKGAIKVYSEKGKGTTFKILLPASEGIAEHANGSRTTGKEWKGSGTILLADDEETIRSLGRRMLERLGFSVLTAANGREVLDLFHDHAGKIDCIILDLTMPHMDGEEAYRELRRASKDVRVIMSSGYNEQEIIQRFAGKGLAGFIQKPYQIADLAAKLKEILG